MEARRHLVEHPEAGEQCERAAAGRLDEAGHLVGQRREVARRCADREGGPRSTGATGPRSRTGCRHRARSPRPAGRRGGWGAVPAAWRWSAPPCAWVHSASCRNAATSRGATRSTGHAVAALHPDDVVGRRPARRSRGPPAARRRTAGGATPSHERRRVRPRAPHASAASACSTRPRASASTPARSSGSAPLMRWSRWGRRASTRMRPASSTLPGRRSSAITPRTRRARSVNRPEVSSTPLTDDTMSSSWWASSITTRSCSGRMHPAGAKVEAVEVQVHHDHVGICGALAGVLREAAATARAARRRRGTRGPRRSLRPRRPPTAPPRALHGHRSASSPPSAPGGGARRAARARRRRRAPAAPRPPSRAESSLRRCMHR